MDSQISQWWQSFRRSHPLALAGWCLLYLGVRGVASQLRILARLGHGWANHWAIGIILIAAFVTIAISLVWIISQFQISRRAENCLFVGCLAGWLLLKPILLVVIAIMVFQVPEERAIHLVPYRTGFWLDGCADLLLIACASLFGRIVARLIRDENILIPVAVVAAAVDFWGVYWGFVSLVSDTAPVLVQQFSAQAPVVGTAGPGATLSSIGVGDFVFLALFFHCIHKFAMNKNLTFWATLIVLLLIPWILSLLPRLPGLPFIALTVIAANWKHFRLSRQEVFALFYLAIGIGIFLGLFFAFR